MERFTDSRVGKTPVNRKPQPKAWLAVTRSDGWCPRICKDKRKNRGETKNGCPRRSLLRSPKLRLGAFKVGGRARQSRKNREDWIKHEREETDCRENSSRQKTTARGVVCCVAQSCGWPSKVAEKSQKKPRRLDQA
jgi:hypothetical protein